MRLGCPLPSATRWMRHRGLGRRAILVAQIHPIAIPVEMSPGRYQAIVGIYDWLSGDRLPVLVDGEVMGDFTAVSPLEIGQ